MDDALTGEIRIFGGNFAPANWAFCQGQEIQIVDNEALYAVIGPTYGGDGQQTFKLPDLRSRIPIGAGQGPGLANYTIGQQTGTETVTLVQGNMPVHSHTPAVTTAAGNITLTAQLNCVDGAGGEVNPGGNYIAEDANAGAALYATTGALVAMNQNAVSLSNITIPAPQVTVQSNGAGIPHNNIQPSIALNYIICLNGIFPLRN